MSVFYKHKENDKIRTGVYRRYVNSDRKRMISNFVPEANDGSDGETEITVAYDGRGNVLLNIPGATISWDGKGNVQITGLNARIAYNNGNVYIGE